MFCSARTLYVSAPTRGATVVVGVYKGSSDSSEMGTFDQGLARFAYVLVDFARELLDPAKGHPYLDELRTLV